MDEEPLDDKNRAPLVMGTGQNSDHQSMTACALDIVLEGAGRSCLWYRHPFSYYDGTRTRWVNVVELDCV